jgi:adenylate cyclase
MPHDAAHDRSPASVRRVSTVDSTAVRRLIDAGECLAAYDLAMSMTAPSDDVIGTNRLTYLRALSLARAGASAQAEVELGAVVVDDRSPPDLAEDVRALAARVVKDRALALDGPDRRRVLADAAERYEAVARSSGGAYPTVNAATLWLLAGETERAADLARAATSLVPADGATYWDLATRAEAELVLGRVDVARHLLADAASAGAGAGDRASTIRQLRLLCDHADLDASVVLAPIANPDVLHFCGYLSHADGSFEAVQERVAAEVDEWLASQRVGDAYGSLACGADIVIAEALLGRGVGLHVVLPFGVDEFVDVSVRPGGAGWVARFEQCLEAATSVEVACDSGYFGDDGLFVYSSDIAMGDAITHAHRLVSDARQLAMWDGVAGQGVAGTGRDVARWTATGRASTTIGLPSRSTRPRAASPRIQRRVAVALFGDFAGFSRLYDEQHLAFHEHVMGAVAEVLDRYRVHLEQARTWGDGLHVVLADVAVAADLALSVQERLAEVDLASVGLPDDLRLRLSAHAGPVMDVFDPVVGAPSVSGRSLTRAARIEPRTPPGRVYVSGAFAALFALGPQPGIGVEYVGTMPTAKGFETIPMYVLHRR